MTRAGTILGMILYLLLIAVTASAQSATNDDFHVSDVAEFYAIHKYPDLKGHKAIAVGPGGYWGNHYGASTAAAASKAALNACNGALRTAKFKKNKKCVIFDVDGKRTGKAEPTGTPFGTAAEGKDRPWQYGKRWDATGATKRGTMLLLHGCNKYTLNGWQMAWVNYYRAAGFRVILPDSFADAREPQHCGFAGEDGADAQTRIMKLRIAQTLRTIAGIRKKYPNEPLYLHGHSEGGFVVQALGEKVDGIIVTGTACGFGSSKVYWVAKDVPILVIAGTRDHGFPLAKSAKALASYCRGVSGSGRMSWASIAGMGHYAAPWWPGIQDAMNTFLKIPPVKINRPASDGVTFPKITKDLMDQYQREPKQKALAANKGDAWEWATGMESTFDAEEAALFGCDGFAGADAFLDPSHKHNCVLVDINGTRLVK